MRGPATSVASALHGWGRCRSPARRLAHGEVEVFAHRVAIFLGHGRLVDAVDEEADVAGALNRLPSEARYVNESVPEVVRGGRIRERAVGVEQEGPCDGPTTRMAVKASASGSMSLPRIPGAPVAIRFVLVERIAVIMATGGWLTWLTVDRDGRDVAVELAIVGLILRSIGTEMLVAGA